MDAIKANARERLVAAGYEGVMIFSDYSYDDALIGVTDDNRAVYDYEKMVEWLMDETGWCYSDAVEWIEYNTIRALSYFGDDAPIVMYRLEERERRRTGESSTR